MQGTLERGGMRLYLVSHLAGGMCGGILKPQILGQDVHVGRKDCKDFQLSLLRFQLNQYVPCGSINAVCLIMITGHGVVSGRFFSIGTFGILV